MKLCSEDPGDTFCYHLDNAPIGECGDEASRIFGFLALNSLVSWEELTRGCFSPRIAEEEYRILENPLGRLSLEEQLLVCKAAQIAIFNGGFHAENMLMEQILHEAMFQNYCAATDEGGLECASLKSWGRLRAILCEKKGLIYPDGSEDWAFLFADSLFWDTDWEFIGNCSTLFSWPDIIDVRNDLKAFSGFDAKNMIPADMLDAVWHEEYVGCPWLKMRWPISQAVKISPSQFGLAPKKHAKKPQKVGPGRQVGKAGFVYCISEQGGKKKIGKTSLSPESRLKALQTANPSSLRLCFAIQHENPDQVEKQIHGDLRQFRCSGEWFDCEEAVVESAFRSVSGAKWTP